MQNPIPNWRHLNPSGTGHFVAIHFAVPACVETQMVFCTDHPMPFTYVAIGLSLTLKAAGLITSIDGVFAAAGTLQDGLIVMRASQLAPALTWISALVDQINLRPYTEVAWLCFAESVFRSVDGYAGSMPFERHFDPAAMEARMQVSQSLEQKVRAAFPELKK